jgi:hypothetical protein
MNKHLQNIIKEYVNFELKFKNELLDNTKALLEKHYDNWYYYNKYVICNEDYIYYGVLMYSGQICLIFNYYYISRRKNKWSICFR